MLVFMVRALPGAVGYPAGRIIRTWGYGEVSAAASWLDYSFSTTSVVNRLSSLPHPFAFGIMTGAVKGAM